MADSAVLLVSRRAQRGGSLCLDQPAGLLGTRRHLVEHQEQLDPDRALEELLPDLPFTRDVTVLQIMNGNNISDVRCAACAACCAVLCCAALSRALPASLREQSAWIGIPSPAAIHLRCCCCSHAAHLLQVATSFSMEKLLGRQRMQVLMAAAV